MNDMLLQNNISGAAYGLKHYGYSGKIFTQKFLKQFLIILLSNLSALILLTADGFIVAHFVGKSAMNSVQLLAPFCMVISSLSGILASGTNYVLSKTFGLGSKEAIDRFFRAIVLLTAVFLLGITIIQIPVLYCMLDIYAVEPEMKEMMYLYAAGLIVTNSVSIVNIVCTYILVASGKAKLLLKLTILESVLNVLFDLFFVTVCDLGVFGAGLGSAVSCLIRGVVSVILVQKTFGIFPLKRIGCKKEMREILTNGLPITLSALATSLIGYLMSATVANYGGQEAVTVVAVCALGGSFIALVANSFIQAGNSMTGLLVASEEWKITKNLHRKLTALCVLVVSAIALIFVLFPQISFAIYHVGEYSEFQETSVRLYMLRYITFSWGLCLTNMCIFCGKKNITIVTGILKSLLLIPAFILLGLLDEDLMFLCYFICEAIPVCILSAVLAGTLRDKIKESETFSRVHFSFRCSEAVDISEKLGNFLREQGAPAQIANRLALVCEEIGSYAGSGGEDPRIFLSVRKSDDVVGVFYLDDGTPAVLNKKLTATDLIIGNYNLIESMAEEFTYQNIGGMNNFIIKFKL